MPAVQTAPNTCKTHLDQNQPATSNYSRHGEGYAGIRRIDPRIAARVHEALGEARTLLNVGAGAGSYKPPDRYVISLEQSFCDAANGRSAAMAM